MSNTGKLWRLGSVVALGIGVVIGQVFPGASHRKPAPSATRSERALAPAELAAQQRQRYGDFYAAAFASQAVDQTWRDEREVAIRAYLSPGYFPGTKVESVECRSSLCRVLLQHDGPEASRRMDRAWGRGPLRDGAATIVDPLKHTTELYLGRQGHAFVTPSAEDLSGHPGRGS